MKTFKLTINEDELKALINHHCHSYNGRYTVEQSARIHDLTKRLNRDTAEIEVETKQAEVQQQEPLKGWA